MFKVVCFLSCLVSLISAYPSVSCRCMPTDTCWPSLDEWAKFNESMGGKLVATVPLASPCHGLSYNATECGYLQSQWTNPFLQWVALRTVHKISLTPAISSDESSSSIMAPAVLNQSCDPFTPTSMPCTLGNMAIYSINASQPSDFVKTIEFVKEKNIRLVIRNTGHE